MNILIPSDVRYSVDERHVSIFNIDNVGFTLSDVAPLHAEMPSLVAWAYNLGYSHGYQEGVNSSTVLTGFSE